MGGWVAWVCVRPAADVVPPWWLWDKLGGRPLDGLQLNRVRGWRRLGFNHVPRALATATVAVALLVRLDRGALLPRWAGAVGSGRMACMAQGVKACSQSWGAGGRSSCLPSHPACAWPAHHSAPSNPPPARRPLQGAAGRRRLPRGPAQGLHAPHLRRGAGHLVSGAVWRGGLQAGAVVRARQAGAPDRRLPATVGSRAAAALPAQHRAPRATTLVTPASPPPSSSNQSTPAGASWRSCTGGPCGASA